MRLLTGAEIQTEVRRIASRTSDVMAAVAYWGSLAAERTGIAENAHPNDVRVICDLLSGACNPAEVEALRGLGVRVKTLDRLHAKVWISGHDVIVGSANASRNGLPREDEQGTNANVEAAVLSQDPSLASELTGWFETQWCASTEIEERHLDHARQLWNRRQRSSGRGFVATLTDRVGSPGPRDRFSALRLLAYRAEDVTPEAEAFVTQNAGRYFTDEEWQDFGEEYPWYEVPIGDPTWKHLPGTVFADFTCDTEGGEFTFNGFWQIRDCPSIELEDAGVRLTLLTRLPHFNGYSLSQQEQTAIAQRVQEAVAQRNHEIDDFGSYIDEVFLEFWDTERTELRQWLVAQVVEAARHLCRTDQFSPSLTLQAIRVCKEDPEWLAAYTRFVGGDIYQPGNPLKKQINQQFGRRVKAGVGAEDQVDEHGEPVREDVDNEIVRSYTLFCSFDLATVERP